MSEQTIYSQDINVNDVFQSFYVVPDYQREYVWETEQVEQLLNDINTERSGYNPKNAPEYFIGSIVVCPGEDGVLELIDGQQRMTTLFITLCAIRDQINKLGEKPSNSLVSMIGDTSTDVYGEDQYRYRVDLQYEDSGDILKSIAQEKIAETAGANTRSVNNICNAYEVVLNFLKHEFTENVTELRKFYAYIINKVKLIRIRTEDRAKALKIFETINDRGVGLDSMDLLKNLLFIKADQDKFEKIKDHWKELQDTIYGMKEKPLRFLRYFVLSRYEVGDILREDDIYEWFSKNEEQCGYAKDPVDFVNELLKAAEDYKKIWKENSYPDGTKSPYVESLKLLSGGATRQHLILLLAGRHLCNDLFDRLTRHVEEILFIYLITGEPARNWERVFANWAKELRKVTDEAGLETFINTNFARVKTDFSERFEDAFRRLSANSIQQYRLRYILAKLTQHIDLKAYGEVVDTKWLSKYTDGGSFTIEHIFPGTPSDEAKTEFGDFEDEYIADYIGNLVLIEVSINSSLGNKPYSQKRQVYPKSKLLLTHALAKRPQIGANTKIDQAVANLDPFDQWNEAAVKKRQDKLTALAGCVWCLPNATKKTIN